MKQRHPNRADVIALNASKQLQEALVALHGALDARYKIDPAARREIVAGYARQATAHAARILGAMAII